MSSIALRISATGEKSSTGETEHSLLARLRANSTELVLTGVAKISLALRPSGGILQPLTGVARIALPIRLLKAAEASKRGETLISLSLRSLVSSGVLLFVQGVAAISVSLRSVAEASAAKTGMVRTSVYFMTVEVGTKAAEAVASIRLSLRTLVQAVGAALAQGIATLRIAIAKRANVSKASTGSVQTSASIRSIPRAEKAATGETRTSLGVVGRALQVVGLFVAGTSRIALSLRPRGDGQKQQGAVARIAASLRATIDRGLPGYLKGVVRVFAALSAKVRVSSAIEGKPKVKPDDE